jgi:hypothetical protein
VNNQPAQQITGKSQHPGQQSHEIPDGPHQAISSTQLADIAELLHIIDGFLRHAGISDHLADYLHTTGLDHPQLPHQAGYNANLLIDQVSLNAHTLRTHHRKPLQ